MKRALFFLENRLAKLSVVLVSVLLATMFISCTQEKGEMLKIGDAGPDFSIKDLDGNVFALSEIKGLPVVIRFFLTDCKFCRADTPIFNEYFTKYGDSRMRMIYIESLGIDSKSLERFRREHAIPFPVASDQGGTIAARYKVKALPQTIVLDPQHKIIAAVLGGVSREELQEILHPYLQ